MRRVLYHQTTSNNAEIILRDKFCTCCNHEHHRGVHGVSPGVWLSNVPLFYIPSWLRAALARTTEYITPERRILDGEDVTALLEVVIDATEAFMEAKEWKGEPRFREWLIEAPELNARILSIRKMARREVVEVSGAPVFSILEYQALLSDHFDPRP